MKTLLISFLISLFFAQTLGAQTVEKTLATVEEEMISLIDLKEARLRLKQGFLNDLTLLVLFSTSALKKKNSALLNFLIYEKLLDLSVKNSDLKIKTSQVRGELKKQRKQLGLSKKGFSRRLVKSQFTSSSYKEFLKRNLLRRMFIQREIIEKIRLTDQELNEYALKKQGRGLFSSFKYDLTYLQFPNTKSGEKQAKKVSQILLKDPLQFDKWPEQKNKVRKEVLKELTLLGMHKSIRPVIKQLSLGQISPIIMLPTGPAIFKILWKTPIITAKNQKRKEQLGQALFQELLKEKLRVLLEDLKKKTFVQINS